MTSLVKYARLRLRESPTRSSDLSFWKVIIMATQSVSIPAATTAVPTTSSEIVEVDDIITQLTEVTRARVAGHLSEVESEVKASEEELEVLNQHIAKLQREAENVKEVIENTKEQHKMLSATDVRIQEVFDEYTLGNISFVEVLAFLGGICPDNSTYNKVKALKSEREAEKKENKAKATAAALQTIGAVRSSTKKR